MSYYGVIGRAPEEAADNTYPPARKDAENGQQRDPGAEARGRLGHNYYGRLECHRDDRVRRRSLRAPTRSGTGGSQERRDRDRDEIEVLPGEIDGRRPARSRHGNALGDVVDDPGHTCEGLTGSRRARTPLLTKVDRRDHPSRWRLNEKADGIHDLAGCDRARRRVAASVLDANLQLVRIGDVRHRVQCAVAFIRDRVVDVDEVRDLAGG